MKKITAFILSFVMVVFCLTPSLSAQANEDILTNAVYYTCDYDTKSKQVVIHGTVNHDFMISHADYRIEVKAVLPGNDYYSAVNDSSYEILAEATMSVKFTFYVEIDTSLERYSKYLIIFSSPNGERTLAAEPKIPSVSSDFNYDPSDKSGYKGVYTDSASVIGESGAGTVIIDVDLGKMKSDSTDSILYPMNNTYIHVKRSYISEIDKKVVAASVANTRIYFRILVSAYDDLLSLCVDNTKKYSIPNMFSEDIVDYVFTMTSFLASRYATEYTIDGIIAGSCVDDIDNVNSVGDITLDQYAELYTVYLCVLGNAVHEKNSKADIVIPLSDSNDYTENVVSGKRVRASEFLDNIFYRLDKNVSGAFHCSLLIETDITPLGITNKNIGNGIDTNYEYDRTRISVSNINDVNAFVSGMSEKYGDTPTNMIYLWHSDKDLSGDALSCAYAYLYSALSGNSFVSAFVADFGDNMASVEKLFKYVNTESHQSVISPLFRYFSDTSWNVPLAANRVLIEKQLLTNRPENILGEFKYLDFTASSVFERINKGENCTSINSDYDHVGTRALHVSSSKLNIGDKLQCIGVFDFDEDYRYTPYISLKLAIDNNKAPDNSLYEISISLGKDNCRAELVGVVRNHEISELYFDISEFAPISPSDYLIVTVRCITDSSNGLSLWLYDMTGYSNEYTSDELDEKIKELRLLGNSENDGNDGGFNFTLLFTIIGVLFSIGAVGIGLLMVFRRDDDNDKNPESMNE